MSDQHQRDRRQFLQASAVGLAIAGTTDVVVAAAPQEKALLEWGEGAIQTDVDVLVVGGGTAGTIAAIQAGRAGARTLLLERNSQLGGATTTGGVAFPGLFDAWGKQVIAGIGWELVRDSVELDDGPLPDFSKVPKRHWQNQVLVNQFLYAILAEDKCEQAGVEIAYYEFPYAIRSTSTGWEVDCVGFGTRRRVKCSQII
ncbi:MAG: FAD-dependent oxidoreductase, partial [Phycisphaerae bacterium]|nr:FAD-dependent oxidoreductase [Phycisphaerae bacterium]